MENEFCKLPRAEAEPDSWASIARVLLSFPQRRRKRELSLDFLFVVVAPAAFEICWLSGLDVVLCGLL